MKKLLTEGFFIAALLLFAGGLPAWSQPAGTGSPGSKAPAAPPAAAPTAEPATTTPSATLVNINTADEAALTAVKGIGQSKAKAIIAYREKNGPFKTVDELTKVKGIKEKSLNTFKAQLTVE